MHGIDGYVLPPPLGALMSLILLSGVDAVGFSSLRALGFCSIDAPAWQRWQAPIVGAALLALLLYPLSLINLTPLAVMRAIARLLAIVGLFNIIAMIRHRREWRIVANRIGVRDHKTFAILLVLLLLGAALMSLAPPTDADSLDYHLGVPVWILSHGGVPMTPEWLHSRLAGGQETLNALGLAAGTDNFGAVLQFAGLLGIAALLAFAEADSSSDSSRLTRRARLLAAVAAISAPVAVPLIAQKPQLMPVAMTSLALALVIYPSRRALATGEALRGHALVCLLVVAAGQAKLSFLLTGCAVGLISLAAMARRGVFWPAAGVGVIAVTAGLLPPTLWKLHYFHDTFVNSVVESMPGEWPGSAGFDTHLRGFTPRTPVPYPLQLFFTQRLNNLTIVLGPAWLLLMTALRPRRDGWAWITLGAIGAVWVVIARFGPTLGRYYVEPYVWVLMLLAIQPRPPKMLGSRWFEWPVMLQALFTIAVFWFGVATLFPGALTPRWRMMVMERNANGYHVMKWVDSVLPSDAVLLTANRSMALAPREVVSFDWASVVAPNARAAMPYLLRLKERGVTHVLMGTSRRYTEIKGCIGPIAAGPGNDPLVMRNPFATEPSFPVWVYEFHSAMLPDCAFDGPPPVQ